MKFAHMGDCHLGGWRHPELKELNFKSFQKAVQICIEEKVEFVLIAGDLFDSAYPPIETLKQTFAEFKKLSDAKIPVFLIAGSHDYSISGKTFLDVLEKAGFAKNVFRYKERNGKIVLEPTIHNGTAIYGFPGRKSGLEVEEIKRLSIDDSPGLFKILMLHTTIKDAVGSAPIPAVDETALPKVDYLALAHLHIKYEKENRVYCGPIFPNNISELEELRHGSFYIFDNGKIRRKELALKEVAPFKIEIQNSLLSTEEIISIFAAENVKDKIVILRIEGTLERGKVSDVDFQKVEAFLRKKGAYCFLKTTSKIRISEPEISFDFSNYENVENKIIDDFKKNNPSQFNELISPLIHSLENEKKEDETRLTFEERILSETEKIVEI